MAENNADYSKQEYWEERYKSEPKYDWFTSRYEDIVNLLDKTFRKLGDPSALKILHLGCGNSSLGPDLYRRGFKNIINIDYSVVVIENMAKEYSQEMPEMTWMAMDVRDLKYEDGAFDIVIDKALMDTFQADKESETMDDDIDRMLMEASRVTKNGGYFYQITWEIPYLRMSWTKQDKYNWDITYEIIGDNDMYRLFTYAKHQNSSSAVENAVADQ